MNAPSVPRAGDSAKQIFVIKCGAAAIYLGPPQQPRVASASRALHFADIRAAESLAAEMRRKGNFPVPWKVVPAEPAESEGGR
jgi:hypothetical protein